MNDDAQTHIARPPGPKHNAWKATFPCLGQRRRETAAAQTAVELSLLPFERDREQCQGPRHLLERPGVVKSKRNVEVGKQPVAGVLVDQQELLRKR